MWRDARAGMGRILVTVLVVLLASIALGEATATDVHTAPAPQLLERLVTQPAARTRARSSIAWHGGVVVTTHGDPVTVLVSDSYSTEPNTPEHWAEFVTGLVHGTEITSVVVYVAPLTELQQVCGDEAVGCYGWNRMYVPGERVDGVTPEMVATHEYGHHIAQHRSNPPWVALDWGPKRWASEEGVCSLEAAQRVFPGDEDEHYELNPGEGFVEAYRALNEVQAGAAAFSWTLVDPIFYPDDRALNAVEQDVLSPWEGPARATLRVRFTERGPRRWWTLVDLPLDGTFQLSATMPLASGYTVTLATVDGSSVLARARWTSGAPSRTLSYLVCGLRGARVQLVRTGGPGVVTMRLSTP